MWVKIKSNDEPMAKVTACDVPEGSLLAEFGGPRDYRDCFYYDVPGEVTLAEFIERFYCSPAFLPERLVLRAIGSNASSADARAVARGEAERFGVWRVIGRRQGDRKGDRPPAGPEGRGNRGAEALRKTRLDQALLESKSTNTASWFAVEPLPSGTRLLFGSWVGNLDQSGWRSMLRAHLWYSRWLLGGV